MADTEQPRAVEPMTPNMNIENTSPSLKRKAVEDDLKSAVVREDNVAPEKKLKTEDTTKPLVELKNHKLIYKQDPPPKIVLTRRQNLAFESLLADAEEAKAPLKSIPRENWVVVIAHGIESTMRTENLFVKQLKGALPAQAADGTDLLPNETIAAVIPKLFTQVDYGFLPSDFGPTVKVPAAFQIRCWEVKEPAKYLTPEQCEAVAKRKAERQQIRRECVKILKQMDDTEKLDLLKGEKSDKVEKAGSNPESKGKPLSEVNSPAASIRRGSREGTGTTADSRRSTSPVKKSKMTPEEEEAARVLKEEKEARKALRAEKKAAEEREAERKKAALTKQAQAMSAFFKPKAAASPVISRESAAGPSKSPLRQTSTSTMSDFHRTFKGIQERANITWAPSDRWKKARRGRSQSPTELLKRGVMTPQKVEEWANSGPSSIGQWQPNDFLSDHIRRHGSASRANCRRKPPSGLKTAPPHGTVADVWNAHQDAVDPRKVLEQLKDRVKYPWKTLAFDQQVRPPYSGTWTRKSVTVGPRTPFAQDAALDYSYDSEEDWQEDEGGEDVDDFKEKEETEDEEEEDEAEDEFDDWLDDAEEGAEAMDVDDDEITVVSGPMVEQSKLPMKVVKKRDAPKKVIKLAPYWKGPLWEKEIGAGSEGMESYRIQALNDTPDSIDPFTYTSKDPIQTFRSTVTTTAVGQFNSVRCLIAEATGHYHAAPAPAVASPQIVKDQGSPSSTKPPVVTTPKVKHVPKSTFPLAHLPELLRLIEGNDRIQSDLVSQLRAHFETVSSKGAIEVKIKEVAVREGKSKEKRWRVKPEAWASCGLPAPVTISASSNTTSS